MNVILVLLGQYLILYINFLQALYTSMDKFLQGLFVLANDPASEVGKLVNGLSFSYYLVFHVNVARGSPFMRL